MHSFLKKFLLFIIIFSVNVFFGQNLLPKQVSIKEGLTSNTVNKVFVDKNSNVWVASSMNTFIYKNGNLFPFFFNNEYIKGCTDIYQDSNSNIWFSTHNHGVYKYTGNELINFSETNGLASNSVNKVYTKGNFVYFATKKGVSILNTSTNKIISPNINQFKKYLEFSVLNFIEINNQVYFITQTDGFFKIVNENDTPRVLKIRNNNYLSSIYLWNNRIYVGEKKRLLIYNVSDYLNNSLPMHELPIYNVSDFSIHGSRLIAVSKGVNINEGGLYRIEEDNTYTKYDNFPKISSKSFNSVDISAKENSAYLATEFDGFLVYDLSPHKNFYKTDNSIVTDIKTFNNDIVILCNNKITIKTISEVTKATLSTSQLANIAKLKNTEVEQIQFSEIITSKDSIYLKTNIGKFVINNNLTQAKLLSNFDTPLVLLNNKMYNISELYNSELTNDFIGNLYEKNPNILPISLDQALDFRQKIVVSSKGNGLFVIEDAKVKSLIDSKEFNENNIKLISKNINDNLVVVTQFNGVYELYPNNKFKVKKHFNTDKLVGQNIFYVDNYKDFDVFGTDAGIEFIKDGFHYVLNKEYGVDLSNYTVANIIGQYLYIGGNDGYYKFHIPNFLAYKNQITDVFISAIYTSKLDGKFAKVNWIDGVSNKITISEEDLPLSINFFPKDKIDNRALLYRFRLNSESTWSEYREKSNLQILKINEGNLQIEVEFFDKITQTSSNFKLLDVEVKTNYTKYIVAFLIVFLLSGLFLIFYKKSDKLSKYFYKIFNDLDFTLVKNETINTNQPLQILGASAQDLIILANQSSETSIDRKILLNAVNSHFVFNIFNYLQYIILEKKPKEAVDYSNDFAQFFRQFLKNAKNSHISLESEIEFLNYYINLESKRFNYIINIRFENPDDLDFTDIFVPAFVLHPLTEIILNYSYNENSENVNINIVFEDYDDNSILITYIHDGLSIEILNDDVNGRLGKEINLLKECLHHNNSDKYNDLTFEDNEIGRNKITFRIDV